jgi:hypothetical protein
MKLTFDAPLRPQARLTQGKGLATAAAHLGWPSTRTAMGSVANAVRREPLNKGKIVGQKAPFKLKDSWVSAPIQI